jgi:5-methylcytosine-specific restriction protein B
MTPFLEGPQIKNMSYYNQLVQFLKQARTNNLKKKHYASEYLETKVNVSFGQGNQARIPWISFLIPPNTTSHGIYPVYLFYKEYDLLILAYGVSETQKPEISWSIDHTKSIKEYFEGNYGKKPDRYGSSSIFKTYDVENLPSKEVLDNDLQSLIKEYKTILEKYQSSPKQLIKETFEIKGLHKKLTEAGLIYSKRLLARFVSSLTTKPFVILTGLSGSGKTKLAQSFVHWICQNERQYKIIPVGADWTNREPILGYPNALNPAEYVKPDNGALDLIIQAKKNPDFPHFLILDEMNLSHVERYFADFLSLMESEEDISLYPTESVENGVPKRLKFPPNLFIIGTVNIDETTHMFSPKVLDRANTIEFRIDEDDMRTFLSEMKPIKMEDLKSEGAGMASSFLKMAGRKSVAPYIPRDVQSTLLDFFSELKKAGAEFGYRTASEIHRLIHNLGVLDINLTSDEKIDIAIMQKLLPKLHGSRRKLCPVLETLASLCLKESENIMTEVFNNDDMNFHDPNVLYPLSLEKIARMYRGAIDNGFASYAEA